MVVPGVPNENPPNVFGIDEPKEKPPKADEVARPDPIFNPVPGVELTKYTVEMLGYSTL